ncbi:MAG: Co2+/Mg2+ efflux protein ApaG [Alphaproteobacteria bacterium]|nr:Co2+/Mg2+ efflux protein ApaG [Alphaproteobacteria bacterium]
MYTQTTHGIQVTVTPFYLEQQSEPERSHYVWAYKVEIENKGTVSVQLLNRFWSITDAAGVTQEVRGPGVVGEQPVLAPGARYEYTSGCPLTTPSGMMVGSYEMDLGSGDMIEVAIPAFSLDSPHQHVRLN